MTRTRVLFVATLAAVVHGCASSESPPRVPQTAADSQAAHVGEVVAAGGVVDSMLPIAEHLRRFRAPLGAPVDTLRGASNSIDELVNRWASALSAHDTTALNAMVLDRAEFAWLYYPESKLSKPPYDAPPDLLWAQFLTNSDDGAKRLLDRFGGASLTVHGVSCPATDTEGPNRLHEGCLVRWKSGASTLEPQRLFGTVFERDGRFKFVGFANAL